MRLRTALASSAAAMLMLTGCSTDQAEPSPTSTGSGELSEAAQEMRELLPASIVNSGVLTVATSGAFPPMNFMADDGETVIGVAAEVVEAMAAELGLEVEYVITPLASILTGLDANRFDIGIIFANNPERLAVVDILDVFQNGHQFLVTSSYEGDGEAPECGSTIAVTSGSSEAAVLGDVSVELCTSKGEPAYVMNEYPSNDEAALALGSNRAVAFFTTAANASYRVSVDGNAWKLLGPVLDPALTGIAISKTNKGLTQALQWAAEQVMESGTYEEILTKWNSKDLGIEAPVLNGQQ